MNVATSPDVVQRKSSPDLIDIPVCAPRTKRVQSHLYVPRDATLPVCRYRSHASAEYRDAAGNRKCAACHPRSGAAS